MGGIIQRCEKFLNCNLKMCKLKIFHKFTLFQGIQKKILLESSLNIHKTIL